MEYDIDKTLKSLLAEKKKEKPTNLLGGDDKIVSIFDELLNKENKDGR
jgi:hypothetical protein